MSAKRQIAADVGLHQGRPVDGIRLCGHSGAQLLLLSRGAGHVVRKTAVSPAQNERLLAQAEQQRQLFFSGISVPRIFESGIDAEGNAYFEMEYVPGQSVANLIAEAQPFDPGPVRDALGQLFDFLRFTTNGTVPVAAFLSKIEQIQSCSSPVCQSRKAQIARAGARLVACDWSGIPQSFGHGDLTLENLMMSPRGNVVFIDCDACFASSYWLDAGKLFQDVSGHWCLRNLYDRGNYALINAVQQMDALRGPLFDLVNQLSPGLALRLPQLAAIHLFRTLPYIRNERIADFVLRRFDRELPS